MENLQNATEESFALLFSSADFSTLYNVPLHSDTLEDAIAQIPQPVSFLRKVYISIDRT